jgi:hypothetical protein
MVDMWRRMGWRGGGVRECEEKITPMLIKFIVNIEREI